MPLGGKFYFMSRYDILIHILFALNTEAKLSVQSPGASKAGAGAYPGTYPGA
jgi:hypothetical protein